MGASPGETRARGGAAGYGALTAPHPHPAGNEALHSLTQAGDYSLRVDLRAGDEAAFAQYDSFRVDSAAQHYRLHLEGFHGTAGERGPGPGGAG